MNRKKLLSILLVLAILLSGFQLGFGIELDNLTQYSMEITLDVENHIVEGVENVSFTNNYNTDLKELVFHLYPDSYKSYETLPSIGGIYIMEGEELPKLTEEEIGYIKINNIHINEKETEYTDENQILKIKLEEPLKKGKNVDITIEFTVKIPEGFHRLHHLEDVYSLTNWYPILSIYDEKTNKWDENPYHPIGESNYSDVSDYNVKLTVPKDMIVAPTGSIIEEAENEENKELTIEAKKVRDFVILMSPNYEIETKEVDGIKISNYYLKNESINKAETAKIILDEVGKTVEFMNNTVGKYAYDELRIAETYLAGGAMEYPQVIQMGGYHDLSKVDIDDGAPFLIEAAVHEAIHQWWYVGVGNDEYNNPFLDESLTVFTTAYYFEKEYDKYHQNGVTYAIRNRIYPSNIPSLNNSVDDFNDWGDYSEAIYTRGPAFFEDLRQRVGEEKFVKILKTYYEKYLFKNANIEDLLNVIETVAGKDIKSAMEKAVQESNYFPENIELTEEERTSYYKAQEKRMIKMAEEEHGLIISSIILRALEGEEVILVKPDNINEEDDMQIEGFINMVAQSFKFDLGMELKTMKENELIDKEKNENLILIGYPNKSTIMKDMKSKLPINIFDETVNINELLIKNENLSGAFIAENPYNTEKLVYIVFLSENKAEKNAEVVEGEIEGERVIVYNDSMYRYMPMYNNDSQFILNLKGIEIKGMYK